MLTAQGSSENEASLGLYVTGPPDSLFDCVGFLDDVLDLVDLYSLHFGVSLVCKIFIVNPFCIRCFFN